MSATTATGLKGIGNMMVPIRDVDEAITFYTEKLGFEKRVDTPFGDGDRWVEVGLPGTEVTLALMPERGDNWQAGRMTGISLTTSDVDGVHATLKQAGVEVDEEVLRMEGPPPPMFWFRDLVGNTFLIVEV